MKQILFASLALLTLTACGVPSWWMNSPTQSMPNGYYYQGNHPVTNPAPTRPWITREQQYKVQNDSHEGAGQSGAGNYIADKNVMKTSSAVSRSDVPKNDSKPLPYND